MSYWKGWKSLIKPYGTEARQATIKIRNIATTMERDVVEECVDCLKIRIDRVEKLCKELRELYDIHE